jgi:hypothetical protein
MNHTDITKSDWDALIASIMRPDNSFDLNDLAGAVSIKFNIDETAAKRLVRRLDQQMTLKPREVARFSEIITEAAKRAWNEPDPDVVKLQDGRQVAREFYDPAIHGASVE